MVEVWIEWVIFLKKRFSSLFEAVPCKYYCYSQGRPIWASFDFYFIVDFLRTWYFSIYSPFIRVEGFRGQTSLPLSPSLSGSLLLTTSRMNLIDRTLSWGTNDLTKLLLVSCWNEWNFTSLELPVLMNTILDLLRILCKLKLEWVSFLEMDNSLVYSIFWFHFLKRNRGTLLRGIPPSSVCLNQGIAMFDFQVTAIEKRGEKWVSFKWVHWIWRSWVFSK